MGKNLFILDSRRVLVGTPSTCRVLGAKHISNPDFGAILNKGERCYKRLTCLLVNISSFGSPLVALACEHHLAVTLLQEWVREEELSPRYLVPFDAVHLSI